MKSMGHHAHECSNTPMTPGKTHINVVNVFPHHNLMKTYFYDKEMKKKQTTHNTCSRL